MFLLHFLITVSCDVVTFLSLETYKWRLVKLRISKRVAFCLFNGCQHGSRDSSSLPNNLAHEWGWLSRCHLLGAALRIYSSFFAKILRCTLLTTIHNLETNHSNHWKTVMVLGMGVELFPDSCEDSALWALSEAIPMQKWKRPGSENDKEFTHFLAPFETQLSTCSILFWAKRTLISFWRASSLKQWRKMKSRPWSWEVFVLSLCFLITTAPHFWKWHVDSVAAEDAPLPVLEHTGVFTSEHSECSDCCTVCSKGIWI